MGIAPSGRQFEIAWGRQRATVVELGAGIREYAVGERQVLEPYPLQAICDGAHGAVLIPWPNRIADGRWRPWTMAEHGRGHVVLQTALLPSSGYPFSLELRILYELSGEGLTVSTTAVNVGEQACPYGAGQHPYLSPGSGTVDDCTLQLAAATRLVNDERMIPAGSEPVAGTELDFRSARPIGDAQFDVALTDLDRDVRGRATARLTGVDGRCVELWVDEHHEFLEIFTGDTLAPARRRTGLAVEPMTCAPNAFQSAHGLLRLEPGETLTTRWGVGLREA